MLQLKYVERIGLKDKKKIREKPKLTWKIVIQHDLKALHIANGIDMAC